MEFWYDNGYGRLPLQAMKRFSACIVQTEPITVYIYYLDANRPAKLHYFASNSAWNKTGYDLSITLQANESFAFSDQEQPLSFLTATCKTSEPYAVHLFYALNGEGASNNTLWNATVSPNEV